MSRIVARAARGALLRARAPAASAPASRSYLIGLPALFGPRGAMATAEEIKGAIDERGWRGVLEQLYTVRVILQPWALLLRTPLLGTSLSLSRARSLSGAPLTPSPQLGEIKRGTLVGTDDGGNRYYENLDYKVNMTRWVEYKDIHNYDSSSVPPRWHGWLHYVSDAPGNHDDQAEFIARGVENIEQLDQGTSHQPCVPCASVRPGRSSPSPLLSLSLTDTLRTSASPIT